MNRATILAKLAEGGLLLLTDPTLPSLTTLVAGRPVRGSWWSHSRGKQIYAVCEALGEHADVVVAKFIAGKVTFVHRRLWAALYALATAREPWQTRGLSATAERLWRSIEREGELPLAELSGDRRAQARLADELEARLCLHGYQVHTEKGSHARVLESWAHWAQRVRWKPGRLSCARARAQFDAAVEAWSAAGTLFPWSEPIAGRRTRRR